MSSLICHLAGPSMHYIIGMSYYGFIFSLHSCSPWATLFAHTLLIHSFLFYCGLLLLLGVSFHHIQVACLIVASGQLSPYVFRLLFCFYIQISIVFYVCSTQLIQCIYPVKWYVYNYFLASDSSSSYDTHAVNDITHARCTGYIQSCMHNLSFFRYKKRISFQLFSSRLASFSKEFWGLFCFLLPFTERYALICFMLLVLFIFYFYP